MELFCKNSEVTILPNARMDRTDCAVLTLHTAKNATVRGQAVLRHVVPFTLESVSFADLTGGLRPEMLSAAMQGCLLYNDSVPYPDKVLPVKKTDIPANRAQAFWILVHIPADMPAGRASFSAVFHTSAGDYTARFFVHIYDVTLPEPKDGAFDHEYFYSLDPTNTFGAEYAPFTEKWWSLMGFYATVMRELRVNCLYLDLYSLLGAGDTKKTGDGTWQFDFSRLDAFVRFFLSHGSFRHLVFRSLADGLTGAHLPSFDENGEYVRLDSGTEECAVWVRAVYGSLYRHFAENGWAEMLIVHLADEPHETGHWKWMRAILREVMPGVPCSEPFDMRRSAVELAGECEVFVPRLEVYEEDPAYFADRQAAGDTLWCYSCCFPDDAYHLNKFIDQPARYARLIKWACYSRNITGFLHWGFNFWDIPTYGTAPDAHFKGDGFIVYPDTENGAVRMSARGLATAEGIADYELLKIAETVDPAASHALATAVARTFSDFSADPDAIPHARQTLLALCEMGKREQE